MSVASKLVGAAVQGAVEAEKAARKRDPVRWLITRGIVAFVLVVGWVFIAWQNKFHISAPVFFVCMGYLAVVMTVVNLWRTGAAAMAPEAEGEGAWARPVGARGELEREKKTLLKAIKEAEFDHEMGKLSKADADAMIATYRARAIEVIKELERYESVDPNGMNVDPAGRPLGQLSVRDQIAREVKARLEVAAAAKKKKKADKADAKADKADAKADKADAKADKADAKADKADKPDAKAEKADEATTDDASADAPAPEAPGIEATEASDDQAKASEATP